MIRTRNIKMCAYLQVQGYEIVNVDKISRGKAEYTIEIEQSEYDRHKILFNNSDMLKYANAIDAVKELAY